MLKRSLEQVRALRNGAQACDVNPEPSTLINLKPSTSNPKPQILKPSYTPNPKNSTLNQDLRARLRPSNPAKTPPSNP